MRLWSAAKVTLTKLKVDRVVAMLVKIENKCYYVAVATTVYKE